MRSPVRFSALLVVLASWLAPGLPAQTLPPLPAYGQNLAYQTEDPDSLPLHLSWQVRPGYLYFVEATDDLTTGDWHCFDFYLLGTDQISTFGDTPVTFRSDLPADRYFLRVRSLESESDGFEATFHRDHDHDGVDSQDELNLGRNPFSRNDADADGLPDDWEYHIVANHFSYDPEPPLEILGADTVLAFSARTALAEWIRAWSVGLRFDFGGKSYRVFNYAITLPDLPASPAETMSFNGQAYDGAALLSFADSTREKVIALRIYPRLWLGAENLPYADLSLEPLADYTWVDDAADPALSGFVFTGTTVDGVTARDLLRRLETRLPANYLGLAAGTTVAMPYRRATVPLPGGGSELRRVPAPLALTSLPLTTVSPTALPMTIRTFFSSGSPGHPDWSSQLAPTAGTLWAEGVQPLLDDDGLPAPVYEFVPPYNPIIGRYLYASGDTFRSWYRRSGPQTYAVPARTSSITPPGATRSYRYGFYSITRADSPTQFNFPPHSDTGNSVTSALRNFTSELHLRLDYDTTTQLYFSSSDDGWVFVNGQLISELNLGGRHGATVPLFVSQLSFSVIRQRLGLPATGTCRVDIFHTERNSTGTCTLRFLSTSNLRPIYVYQAEADALLDGPLTYQLDQSPSGVSIAPATGKITWDLYAPRGSNGLPTVAPGDYPVTVRVTDTHGHSDLQSFILTVAN